MTGSQIMDLLQKGSKAKRQVPSEKQHFLDIFQENYVGKSQQCPIFGREETSETVVSSTTAPGENSKLSDETTFDSLVSLKTSINKKGKAKRNHAKFEERTPDMLTSGQISNSRVAIGDAFDLSKSSVIPLNYEDGLETLDAISEWNRMMRLKKIPDKKSKRSFSKHSDGFNEVKQTKKLSKKTDVKLKRRRKKYKKIVRKFTKEELEDFVVENFMQNGKTTPMISELHQKCNKFKRSIEKWRGKALDLQEKCTHLTSAVQMHITNCEKAASDATGNSKKCSTGTQFPEDTILPMSTSIAPVMPSNPSELSLTTAGQALHYSWELSKNETKPRSGVKYTSGNKAITEDEDSTNGPPSAKPIAKSSASIATTPTAVNVQPNPNVSNPTHPAPLPTLSVQRTKPGWRMLPPKPVLRVIKRSTGEMTFTWNMLHINELHSDVEKYELYFYEECAVAKPHPSLWKPIGAVWALPLPMACTLNGFSSTSKYHFAIRILDCHDRFGPFSDPVTI